MYGIQYDAWCDKETIFIHILDIFCVGEPKKVKFLVMNWMDMSIWIVFGHWKQVTTHAFVNVTLWIVIIGYVMFFSCFTVNLHCLSYYFSEIYAFLCVSLHFVFEITLHHKHLALSVGNELWLAIPWSARVVIFPPANSDDEQPSIDGLVLNPSIGEK